MVAWMLAGLLVSGVGLAACAQDDDPRLLLSQANQLLGAGQHAQAAAIATRVLQLDPEAADAFVIRARARDALGQEAECVRDYTAALKLDESRAHIYVERGWALYQLGRFDESVADFDAYVKIDPDSEPYLWQRGIAQYYAAQFAAGVAQFVTHRTVNGDDVENSVWHLLCAVRQLRRADSKLAAAAAVKAAREQFLEIPERDGRFPDRRIPMREAYHLFAGTGTREQMLDAAKAVTDPRRRALADFYAQLYLGLYEEMLGNAVEAQVAMTRSAALAPDGAMGDVARVHARVRAPER